MVLANCMDLTKAGPFSPSQSLLRLPALSPNQLRRSSYVSFVRLERTLLLKCSSKSRCSRQSSFSGTDPDTRSDESSGTSSIGRGMQETNQRKSNIPQEKETSLDSIISKTPADSYTNNKMQTKGSPSFQKIAEEHHESGFSQNLATDIRSDSSTVDTSADLRKSSSPEHQKRSKEPSGPKQSSVTSSLHLQEDTKIETKSKGHTGLKKDQVANDHLRSNCEKTMLSLDSEEQSESMKVETKSKEQTRALFSIVFVSSEVAPYSKTGGLADVSGSLPIALAARGHRVMVVSPRYMNGLTDERYSAAFDVQCRITINCFEGTHEVAYFHEYRDGVDWVFVDHPSYHRPGNPYGDQFGSFGDNQFRFTILSYAACEAPLVLPLGGYTYGEKCIFVVNDWHASLVSVLLSAKYRPYGVYRDARAILLIHNLAHQGVEPSTTYGNLGLPSEWYGALEWVFPTWARKHALDKGEAVNHLKGAVVTSDRILTVSQGYAWEITTAEGGWGLDGLLRSRKSVINGIINGIDVNEWNPASDKYIACQYDAEDISGKAQCKAALQKELGLATRADVPLIGFIGRLDYQKGVDLIQSVLPELMQEDVQFVMLGSGSRDMESWMKWAESTYKEKFRGWVGFNVPISHRITAGCDILLMPSRFEPCGLNQLYAMRYGTVPIVHSTGGLRDTVQPFDPFANEGAGSGTGYVHDCT
eukprot:TRINITY_DN18476_c0_g1_i1.p1 TRINITY_DN18476_c0_g1~~TRINITY_DN18476_c0_g1_i1.p1  ORF type:complete len:701 (+),score=137.24 TRINITY_DN18476_c0_g1_i1:522-2624(+)